MDYNTFVGSVSGISSYGLISQLETVMHLYGIKREQIVRRAKKLGILKKEKSSWDIYLKTIYPVKMYIAPFIYVAYEIAGISDKLREPISGEKPPRGLSKGGKSPRVYSPEDAKLFSEKYINKYKPSPQVGFISQIETVMSLCDISRDEVMNAMKDAGYKVESWERPLYYPFTPVKRLLVFVSLTYQLAGIDTNKVVPIDGINRVPEGPSLMENRTIGGRPVSESPKDSIYVGLRVGDTMASGNGPSMGYMTGSGKKKTT